MASQPRPKNKARRSNPLQRGVRTLFGPEKPVTLADRMEVARDAQYFSLREQGMTHEEAVAVRRTMNVHPNRKRGMPNVPLPNSRERKNGGTISKKLSKQALAREIKAAERWYSQMAAAQRRVVDALVKSAGHSSTHPAVQQAKKMAAPAKERLRRLRAQQRRH